MAPGITRPLLAWCLLATLVQAQNAKNTTDLPDNQFQPWNDHPNATAILPIAGFDLNTRYPGTPLPAASSSGAGNSWRLQLNFTESQQSPYFDGPTTLITSHLIPPAGALFDDEGTGAWDVDEDVASTWRLTVISLDEGVLGVGAGNNADGSCEGIVPGDCMREMRGRISKDYATAEGDGYPHQPLTNIDSCPFRSAVFHSMFLALFFFSLYLSQVALYRHP